MRYFVAQSLMTQPSPVRPEEMKEIYIPAHVAHLQDGIRRGLLLLGGPNELGGGFLLLRGESRAEVEAFLEQDPFRIHGLNRFCLTEFFPNERSEWVKNW